MDTRMETRFGKQYSLGWVDNCSPNDISAYEYNFSKSPTAVPVPRRQGPLSFKICSKSDLNIRQNMEYLSVDLCSNSFLKGKQNINEYIFNKINRLEEKSRLKNNSGAGDVGCKDDCRLHRASSCTAETDHKTTHSDKKGSCKYRSKKTHPNNTYHPISSSTSTDLDSERLLNKLRLYALDKYQRQNKIPEIASNTNRDVVYSNNYNCNPADILGIPSHTPIVQQVYENKLDKQHPQDTYFEHKFNEENVHNSSTPYVPANNYEYAHNVIGNFHGIEREEPHNQVIYNENEYPDNNNVRYEEYSALKNCYKRSDQWNISQALAGISENNLMSCKSERRSKPVHCNKNKVDIESNVGDEEHYLNFTSYINRNNRKLTGVCDNGFVNSEKQSKQHNTINGNENVCLSKIGKESDSFIRSSEFHNSEAKSRKPNIHKREEIIDGLLARIMPVQECGSDTRDELTTKVLDTIRRNGGDFIPDCEKNEHSQSCISFMNDKLDSGNDCRPPGYIDQSAHSESYNLRARCSEPPRKERGIGDHYSPSYNENIQFEKNSEYQRYIDDYCLDPDESALLRGYNIFEKKKVEGGDNFFSKSNSDPPPVHLDQNGNSNKKSEMHTKEDRERSSSNHSSSRLLDFIKYVPSKMMFLSKNSEKQPPSDQTSITTKPDTTPTSHTPIIDQTKITSKCLNTPKIPPQNHSTSVDPVNGTRTVTASKSSRLTYEHRNNIAFQGREFRSKSQTNNRVTGEQKKKYQKYSLAEKYQSKYRKKEFEDPLKKPVKPTLVTKNTSMYDKYVRKTPGSRVPTYNTPSANKPHKDPRGFHDTKSDIHESAAKSSSQHQGDSKLGQTFVNSNTQLTQPEQQTPVVDNEAKKKLLKETIRQRAKSHIYYNRRLHKSDDKNMGDANTTTGLKNNPTPKSNEVIRGNGMSSRPQETPRETPEAKKARQCFQVVEPNIKPLPQADIKLCRGKKGAGLVNSVISGKTRIEGKETRSEQLNTQGDTHGKQKVFDNLIGQKNSQSRHDGRGTEIVQKNQQLKKQTETDRKKLDTPKYEVSTKEKENQLNELGTQKDQHSEKENENKLDKSSSEKMDKQSEKENRLNEVSSKKDEQSDKGKQKEMDELGSQKNEQPYKEKDNKLDVDKLKYEQPVKENTLDQLSSQKYEPPEKQTENQFDAIDCQKDCGLVTNSESKIQNESLILNSQADTKPNNQEMEKIVKDLWNQKDQQPQQNQHEQCDKGNHLHVEGKENDINIDKLDKQPMKEDRENKVQLLHNDKVQHLTTENGENNIGNLANQNVQQNTVQLVSQNEVLLRKEQEYKDHQNDIRDEQNIKDFVQLTKEEHDHEIDEAKACVDQSDLNDKQIHMEKIENNAVHVSNQGNQQVKEDDARQLDKDNDQTKDEISGNYIVSLDNKSDQLCHDKSETDLNNQKSPYTKPGKNESDTDSQKDKHKSFEEIETNMVLLKNKMDQYATTPAKFKSLKQQQPIHTENKKDIFHSMKLNRTKQKEIDTVDRSPKISKTRTYNLNTISDLHAPKVKSISKVSKPINNQSEQTIQNTDTDKVKSSNNMKGVSDSPKNTTRPVTPAKSKPSSVKGQNYQKMLQAIHESELGADPAFSMTLVTPMSDTKMTADGSPTCPQLTPLGFIQNSPLVTEEIRNDLTEACSPSRPKIIHSSKTSMIGSARIPPGSKTLKKQTSPKEKALALTTDNNVERPSSRRKFTIGDETNRKGILSPKIIHESGGPCGDDVSDIGIKIEDSDGDTAKDIEIKVDGSDEDNAKDVEIKVDHSDDKDIEMQGDDSDGENAEDIEVDESAIDSENLKQHMSIESEVEGEIKMALYEQDNNISKENKSEVNEKLNVSRNIKTHEKRNYDDFPNVTKSYIRSKSPPREKIDQDGTKSVMAVKAVKVNNSENKTQQVIQEIKHDGTTSDMAVKVNKSEHKTQQVIKENKEKSSGDYNIVNEIKSNIILTKDIVKEVKKDVNELKDRLGKMESNLTAEKSKQLEASDGTDHKDVDVKGVKENVKEKPGLGELAHKLGGVLQSALKKISGGQNNDKNRTDIKTVTTTSDASPMKRKRDPKTKLMDVNRQKQLVPDESMANCPKGISKEIQFLKNAKPDKTPITKKDTSPVSNINDHAKEYVEVHQLTKGDDDDSDSASLIESQSYNSDTDGASTASLDSLEAGSDASTASRESLTKIKYDLKRVNDRLQRFISSSTDLAQPSIDRCTNLEMETSGYTLASGDVASFEASDKHIHVSKDATPPEGNDGQPHGKYGPPPHKEDYRPADASDDQSSDESDASPPRDEKSNCSNESGDDFQHTYGQQSFKEEEIQIRNDASPKKSIFASPPVELTSRTSSSELLSEYGTQESIARKDVGSYISSDVSSSVASDELASETKYVSSDNGFVGTISDQSDSISKCQLFVDKCQQFIDEQANRVDVVNSLSDATQDSPSDERISGVVETTSAGRENISTYKAIDQHELNAQMCNTSNDASDTASEESDIDIINGVFESICDHSDIISKCRELVDEQSKQIQSDLESITDAEHKHKQFLDILEDLEAILSDTSLDSVKRPTSNPSNCSCYVPSDDNSSSVSPITSVCDLEEFSSSDKNEIDAVEPSILLKMRSNGDVGHQQTKQAIQSDMAAGDVTNFTTNDKNAANDGDTVTLLEMFSKQDVDQKPTEQPVQSDMDLLKPIKESENEKNSIQIDNTLSCCSEVIVSKSEVAQQNDYDLSDASSIGSLSNSSTDNFIKDVAGKSKSPEYPPDSQTDLDSSIKLDSDIKKSESRVYTNSIKSYYRAALDTITSFVKKSPEANLVDVANEVPPNGDTQDVHKTLDVNEKSPDVPKTSPLIESSPNIPKSSPINESSPNIPKTSPLNESSPNITKTSPKKESSPDVQKQPVNEISKNEPKFVYLDEPNSKPKRRPPSRQSRFQPPTNSYALLSGSPEVSAGVINSKPYIEKPSSRILDTQNMLQSAKENVHETKIEKHNETPTEQMHATSMDEAATHHEPVQISERIKQLSEFSSDTANSQEIRHDSTPVNPHLNRYLYKWGSPSAEMHKKLDESKEVEDEPIYLKMGKSIAEAFSNTIENLEERFISPPKGGLLSTRFDQSESKKAEVVSNTTPHEMKFDDLKQRDHGQCGDCNDTLSSKYKYKEVIMNSPKHIDVCTTERLAPVGPGKWSPKIPLPVPKSPGSKSPAPDSPVSSPESKSIGEIGENCEKTESLKTFEENSDPLKETVESAGNGEGNDDLSGLKTDDNSEENSKPLKEKPEEIGELKVALSEPGSLKCPEPRKELFGFRRGLRKIGGVLNPQKELFGFRRGLRKLGERLSGTDVRELPKEEKIQTVKDSSEEPPTLMSDSDIKDNPDAEITTLNSDVNVESDVKDEPRTEITSEKDLDPDKLPLKQDVDIGDYLKNTSPIPDYCTSKSPESIMIEVEQRNAEESESVSSSVSGCSSDASDFSTDESIHPSSPKPTSSEKSDTDREGSLSPDQGRLSQTGQQDSDISGSDSESDSESHSISLSANSSIADVVDSNIGLHSSVVCMPTSNSLTKTGSFSAADEQNARYIHGGDSEIILSPTQLKGNDIVCKPVFYNARMGMPAMKTLQGNSMQQGHPTSAVGYSWPYDKRHDVCQEAIDSVLMKPEKEESDIHLNLLELFDQIEQLETEMGEAFGPNKNCQPVGCKVSLEDVEIADKTPNSPTMLSESDSQDEGQEEEPEFDDLYTIMQPSFPPEEYGGSMYTGNVHSPSTRDGFRVQELDSCYHPGLDVHQENELIRPNDMQLCDYTPGEPGVGGTKLKLKPIIDDVKSFDNLLANKDSQFDIRSYVNIQPSTFSVPFPEYCSRMNTKEI